MKKQNIIEGIEKYMSIFQLILAFVILALIVLSPVLEMYLGDNENIYEIKLSLFITFGLLIFHLLIRFYKEVRTNKSVKSNPVIEESVVLPVLFTNYLNAQDSIINEIKQLLINNENVHLQIMGVSTQYSWKLLIEDELVNFLQIGNGKQKIDIDIFIVDPSHLEKWNQDNLIKYSQMCIDCHPKFLKNLSSSIGKDRLSINVYTYDNIPHRHGILINNKTLFRSKCSFRDNELMVGQNYYKMFKLKVHYEAQDSIDLFNNWAQVYKERSSYLDSKEKPLSVIKPDLGSTEN